MQQPILYEFPLSERMRNFMRLENLFAQINYLAHLDTFWDSQTSILSLLEILNILDRNDVRGEVTRELERNITKLSNLIDIPNIDTRKLQEILDQLQTNLHAMQGLPPKNSRNLRDDDLLNSVRQRVAVSATVNNFDVPGFYFWLHQPTKVRQQQFNHWLQELRPIESGITLLNDLLRNSANFESQTASAGFFQRSLNPQQASQMVRILLPADAKYFPETSGSKHRVNIRFLTYENSAQRPTQVVGDVEFKISCCSI